MRRPLLLAALAIIVVACATGNPNQRQREQTMNHWQSMVRWSEYDGLVNMIHPEWLAEHPVSSFELQRLRQFRVTEYRVRSVNASPDGLTVERHVRIRLYHIHSARERVIDHREVWRYDQARESWMLHSGLPDPRQT